MKYLGVIYQGENYTDLHDLIERSDLSKYVATKLVAAGKVAYYVTKENAMKNGYYKGTQTIYRVDNLLFVNIMELSDYMNIGIGAAKTLARRGQTVKLVKTNDRIKNAKFAFKE